MTDIRVTAVDVQVAGIVDANPRIFGQSLEVLGVSPQPEIQVTQFNVDVAGTVSSVLHLGRMYMEVLSQLVDPREIDLDITSSVSLGSESDNSLIVKEEISEIDFTSDVDLAFFRPNHLVAQPLVFTQLVGYGYPRRVTASSNLDLLDTSIYVGPHWYTLTSTLDLDSSIRIPDLFIRHCSNSLSMSQATVIHGKRLISAESELQLETFSDTHIKTRRLTDQLDFTSDAVGTSSKMLYSDLELDQDAVKGRYDISVDNELEFGQLIHINPITVGPGARDRIPLPAQEIGLEQVARNSIVSVSLETTLDIVPNINVTGPIYVQAVTISQWVEDDYTQYGDPYSVLYGLQDSATVILDPRRAALTNLGIEHLAQKVRLKAAAINLSASNILEISTGIPTITYLDAGSILALESAADTKAGFGTSDIDFSSQVTYNINFAPRLASSQLDFVSAFFAVPQQFSLCPYSPFVGSTTDPAAPQNILKNQPVIDPARRGVTLFYPWSSPTTTLDLRGPDFGNRNRLEFQRINRETRGGTLIIWADPIWPKNERLVLNFAGLTEAEGQSALDFIALSLGKEIGFTDWEGNTVHGVIMTPSEPLVRDGRHSLSLGLEIEIAHSVIVGTCISDLLVSNLAYQNRNRAFNVESSIDFELVSEYN